jgi:F0F1-type ATP synthase assembly protein I
MTAGGGSSWRQGMAVAALGTTIFACVILGFGAGYLADGWLGTQPWLSLLGFGLGVAAAALNLVRAIRALNRMGDDDGA